MQTAAQTEVEGVRDLTEPRTSIDQHIAELEGRFGWVTAARVAVRDPGDRHQIGGQYLVGIRPALPDGREVNVGPYAEGRRTLRRPNVCRG